MKRGVSASSPDDGNSRPLKSVASLRDETPLRYANEESISLNLMCPICDDVLVDPQMIAACEHVFCGACIGQWKKRTCPVCREAWKELREAPRALKAMLDELKVRCVHEECEAVMRRDQLPAHLARQCAIHEMPCPNDGCDVKCKRKDLESHVKLQCGPVKAREMAEFFG